MIKGFKLLEQDDRQDYRGYDPQTSAILTAVLDAGVEVAEHRSGRFLGRCPFHEEKTPSFCVYPKEEKFLCLGCGKTGDAERFRQCIATLGIIR